jgi:nitrate reductase gamma subunit
VWDQSRPALQAVAEVPVSQSVSQPNVAYRVDVGAIAGGVVGGVVGLLAILGLVWFLLRRKRRNMHNDFDDNMVSNFLVVCRPR